VTEDPISVARAAAGRGSRVGNRPYCVLWLKLATAKHKYQLGFLAMTECDLISGREAFSLFRDARNRVILRHVPPSHFS